MKCFCAIAAILLATLASSAQCPTITVIGPAAVTQPGDSMTFTVTVSPAALNVEYMWTVSAGTIIAGRGTSAIQVSTDRSLAGMNITADATVKGLNESCNNTATETAPIAPLSGDPLIDEWGKIKSDEIRARLDAFFTELSSNPSNTGILVIDAARIDRMDARNPRLRLIVNHARFRKFDLSRLWFLLEKEGEFVTKLFRLPPGAEMLSCYGECKTIKGGDIK